MATGNYNKAIKAMSDAELDAKINQGLTELSSAVSRTSSNAASQLQTYANTYIEGTLLRGIPGAITQTVTVSPGGFPTTITYNEFNFAAVADKAWSLNVIGAVIEKNKEDTKLMKKVDKVFDKLYKKVSKELATA